MGIEIAQAAVGLSIGLVLLYFGGECIVGSGVRIARRIRISPLLVGIAIVGFGTSLPEMIVSLNAHMNGYTDVAVGNVVGSNITNILLVLGAAAIIASLPCSRTALRTDGLALVAATALFVGLALFNLLTFVSGALLVTILAAFLFFRYTSERRLQTEAGPDPEPNSTGGPAWKDWLWIGAAMVMLWAGSKLFVIGAVKSGGLMGLSGAVIGLTIVALGTSLPELATTVVAAFRNETDLLLGNIFGSNMFNILCIVGIAALVAPIPVASRFITVDLWVLAAVTACLLFFGYTGRRLARWEGATLFGGYLVYLSVTPII